MPSSDTGAVLLTQHLTLWQSGAFYLRRNAAYSWLSEKMALPKEETHIGMFDVEECISTIFICSKETKGDY